MNVLNATELYISKWLDDQFYVYFNTHTHTEWRDQTWSPAFEFHIRTHSQDPRGQRGRRQASSSDPTPTHCRAPCSLPLGLP